MCMAPVLSKLTGGDHLKEEEEEWKQLCRESHKKTSSKYWQEFAWKLYSRFSITPNVQSKMNSSIKSEC